MSSSSPESLCSCRGCDTSKACATSRRMHLVVSNPSEYHFGALHSTGAASEVQTRKMQSSAIAVGRCARISIKTAKRFRHHHQHTSQEQGPASASHKAGEDQQQRCQGRTDAARNGGHAKRAEYLSHSFSDSELLSQKNYGHLPSNTEGRVANFLLDFLL